MSFTKLDKTDRMMKLMQSLSKQNAERVTMKKVKDKIRFVMINLNF